MHCYVERYKIIETPTNSNKFTEVWSLRLRLRLQSLT